MLGQHDLAGDIAEAHLVLVVDEGHAFAIAGGADGNVCGDEVPARSHQADYLFERRKILVHFLYGADIKRRKYLSDIEQALTAARAVAELVIVEIAQVPCADDDGGILGLAGDTMRQFGFQARAQVQQAARSPVTFCQREKPCIPKIRVPGHTSLLRVLRRLAIRKVWLPRG